MNVRIDSMFTDSLFTPSTVFNIPDATYMLKYSAQMRQLRNRYFDTHEQEDDTYYLFVVNALQDTVNNHAVDGYMVRGKSVGFISTSSIGLSASTGLQTIAHELGHGIGALSHTWNDNGPEQGSTDNLMDYSTNTTLIRQQWEELREPKGSSFWDEEEDFLARGDIVIFDFVEVFRKETIYFDFDDRIHELTMKNIKRIDSLHIVWYVNDSLYPTNSGKINFRFKSPILKKTYKFEAKSAINDSSFFIFYLKPVDLNSLTLRSNNTNRGFLFDDTYNFSTDSIFISNYEHVNKNDSMPRIPLVGIRKDFSGELLIPELFDELNLMKFNKLINVKIEAEKSGYALFNDKEVFEFEPSEIGESPRIFIKPIKFTGNHTNFNTIRVNIKIVNSDRIVGAFDLICLPLIEKTVHLVHVKSLSDSTYPNYLSKANSENFLNNQSLSQLFCNVNIIDHYFNLNLTSDSIKNLVWKNSTNNAVTARTALYDYLTKEFFKSKVVLDTSYGEFIENTKTSTLFFVTNFSFDYFETYAAFHWSMIGKGFSLKNCDDGNANHYLSHELGHWLGFPHTFESNPNHPICINPIKKSTQNYMDYSNTLINWSKTQLILVK